MYVRRIVSGQMVSRQGVPYKTEQVGLIWDLLLQLNQNPTIASELAKRRGSQELCRALFQETAATLTGRLRGRVDYCAARNTPFQGLAADGAKPALFRLTAEGYRVVAFVHDEIVVELPSDVDHDQEAERVKRIMCEAMGEVTRGVPVRAEAVVMERWSKKAEPIYDGDGRLTLWKEESCAARDGHQADQVMTAAVGAQVG